MPHVSVWVDAEDVLEDLDDEELRQELKRREERTHKGAGGIDVTFTDLQLLERAYQRLRNREIPDELREYIGRVLGKIL